MSEKLMVTFFCPKCRIMGQVEITEDSDIPEVAQEIFGRHKTANSPKICQGTKGSPNGGIYVVEEPGMSFSDDTGVQFNVVDCIPKASFHRI